METLKCCVGGCAATGKTLRFFCFPRNSYLRSLWMSLLAPTYPLLLELSEEQLLKQCVCQKHFDKTQFDEEGKRIRFSYTCLFTENGIALGEPLNKVADIFDKVLSKAEHALVVFYAPWCGHCKRIKPELEKAATRIKNEKITGIVAAVDATEQPELASRFGVKGYPTLKYFYKGEYKYDAGHARQENQIIDFIKDPKEPPAPPPPEKPWAEEDSAVRHLDPATFRNTLRKVKHALVMFYAPWCGHCKSTKPHFTKAAEAFTEQLTVAFAAVDCTAHQQLCANYDVKGYPTIKYFSYFDKLVKDYTGGRKILDFMGYIHTHIDPDLQDKNKPKTNQEAGFGINVVLIDDVQLDSFVSSSTPTIVMYYASWCGHCWTAKPAFSKLATKFKNENYPIHVIAIDAAENPMAADFGRVEVLPTFRLYRSGQELATYDGDRSLEDLVKFCETHTKQVKKDEL